jgi:uncharacterized protein (TIGR03382 family)
MGMTRSARVEELADRFWHVATATWGTLAEQDVLRGAFQLAIWELSEGDGDPHDDEFASFSDDAKDQAEDWISDLTGAVDLNFIHLALTSDVAQDQIIRIAAGGGGCIVPEASSVMVWSMMAFGLGWLQRRRRNG